MAFRQPTYHAPQRTYSELPINIQTPIQHTPTNNNRPLDESQEWVLFSPGAASVTDRTCTTSTDRTRTAGHSHVSDLGSLDTAARSYGYYEEEAEGSEVAVEDEEEDGELDSLDSHLHEFRTEPSVYRQDREGENSGTVLPTHDGLGSFRVDPTAMGEDVQNHLYAFERFNPRRVKRRRESLEIGEAELESERLAEAERTKRIEQWRSEQSRLLVDEIQKETRRRKLSMSSERRSTVEDKRQEDVATLNDIETSAEPREEHEGFWNRITRRVIRDLMGIDDDLLSILFGEALPKDDDLSTTPPANRPFNTIITRKQHDQSSWEYRLLDRIAKELGLLVNQLSDHPGAFSTYLQTTQTPLPYAGLPSIPEVSKPLVRAEPENPLAATLTPVFQPTLPQTLPTASTASFSERPPSTHPTTTYSASLTREEWERDLDIKMVFKYLRSRFTSSSSSSPTASPSPDLSSSKEATEQRAARVRAQHPLVTPSSHMARQQKERRTWRASIPGERRGSNCASEVGRGSVGSAKGGKRGTSRSSRNYWDLQGGSVGQGSTMGSNGGGSLVISTGGMGSWGEV